jgi:hypothetical protein
VSVLYVAEWKHGVVVANAAAWSLCVCECCPLAGPCVVVECGPCAAALPIAPSLPSKAATSLSLNQSHVPGDFRAWRAQQKKKQRPWCWASPAHKHQLRAPVTARRAAACSARTLSRRTNVRHSLACPKIFVHPACARLSTINVGDPPSSLAVRRPPAPSSPANAAPAGRPLCFRRAPDPILATVPGVAALSATHPATPSPARLRDGLTNVGPMSQQTDAQANTSPPASVRSTTPPHPGHGAAQPESDQEAVTPKTLAQTGRSKTAPNVQESTLWKSSIDRPQLSERDSIFATTYLAADSPTSSPRTSARQLHHDDAPEHSLSAMAAPAPLQRRLIDPPVFRRKQSVHPPPALNHHHQLLATHFNSPTPTAGTRSDDTRRSPPPFMSPVDSPVHRATVSRLPDVQSALNGVMENSEERKRNIAWRGGKPVAFKGTGAPETSSVNGDSEKKIDVTLANIEQPSTARSRKASHYLRVFKDADGGEDQKPRDSRTKERRQGERRLLALHEDGQARSSSNETSALTEQLQRLSRPPSAAPSPQTGPTEGYFEKVPAPQSETGPSAHSSHKEPASVPDAASYKRPLPHYVLDEIRSIANLTPGAQPGSSFSRSLPTSAVEKFDAHISTTAARQHQPEEPTDYFQSRAEESAERSPTSEEEDSEREQISSALYFPHRRLKTSEQLPDETQDSEAEAEGNQAKSFSQPGKAAGGWAEGEALRAPQEVEISLQSQDTNQCLYGDIHAPAPLEHHEEEPLNATNVDALSAESETESLAESTHSLLGYESSATDDLGTTPTATTHLKEAKAKPAHIPQPGAPVDAVELKPYDHQVGGHSTVYRFSKRAVCKQLNNRENEFYETLEQHHPELLDFLPRYDSILAVWSCGTETSSYLQVLSMFRTSLTLSFYLGTLGF